ncbi:MAG: hypothetical protein WAU68_09615 [Vitreimonas sp.]
MSSSAPPVSSTSPQPQLRPQASEADASPVGNVAAAQSSKFEVSISETFAPANLMISYDESADRFVQTLTDANTSETLRRYPNDAQLSYSRAVTAYIRAMADAVNKT